MSHAEFSAKVTWLCETHSVTSQYKFDSLFVTHYEIEAETSDMVICRSEGGMPCFAGNYRAERGMLPEDRQIIMSEVSASIIDFVFISIVQ